MVIKIASNDDIKLFISEAEDLIQKVELEILNLEEEPSNLQPIQELYFAFHTLKGLTAMVGLENVSEFCHNFENLLDKSKNKDLSESKIKQIIELMFDSLDVLRSVLKNVKKGDMKDIDPNIVSELKGGFDEVESEYDITFIKRITLSELKEYFGDKSKTFYKISIKIQSTCVFKKVRLFIIFRALNDIGKLVWSKPKPELLEAGEIDLDFDIYFITEKSTDDISNVLDEILEIENKVIKELSKDEFKEIIEDANAQVKTKGPSFDVKSTMLTKSGSEKDLDKISKMINEFAEDTTKITSIKVDIQTLEKLMDYFGEVIILKNQLNQMLLDSQDRSISRVFDNMDKLFLEIQEMIFNLKLVRVETTFRRYKRLVRDVAKETGKSINFSLEGTDVEMDRKILEQLNSPLIHVIRNAIYHGIEHPEIRAEKGKPKSGKLKVKTFRRSGSVYIEVIDDGRGIDYESIRQKVVDKGLYTMEEAEDLTKQELNKVILTPGFSTLASADMISGRGMGLAIVTEKIRELGGSLTISSKKNAGTKFTLTVPFSRAILKAQLFKVGGELYAIPIENITQIYFFNRENLDYVKGEEYYRLNENLVPIVRLNQYLDVLREDRDVLNTLTPMVENKKDVDMSISDEYGNSKDKIGILCSNDNINSTLFVVDEILHQMDVVIKPFRSKFSEFTEIMGVSITGDGSICIIIDAMNIISKMVDERKELQAIEVA
ncbi:MAG: hypothetical protein GF317_06765 [Candidatus Lokiarchaeota archaeon]|nr:hypothetical protein [Candidatus Lokiarchaeota archaeon]MBD3199411.1 hypothetical protein [Candidatus Lokiarchaeota archaeon]